MSLEEYTKLGSSDTFTWWMERGLGSLGKFWPGSGFAFGIFEPIDKNKEYKKKFMKSAGNYA